ncbi:MAG: fatty acid hydroxylase [Bacteroidetes bacterium]|jgi:sterol desaturase/sphingolipid hydroxylase (fatty acid hydroxylase superfamily)|nr:fatty acid hydroxylase [Bacteroidota bacterium]
MAFIHQCVAFCRTLTIEQIAAILFAGFLCIEWLSSKLMRLATYRFKDSVQNFMIGAISFVFDYLFSVLSFPLLLCIFHHARLFDLSKDSIGIFCLLFVLVDLSEYWFHRLCHEINILWRAHIVHHQSEEFNLSVGLRTSLFIPFFNIFLYALFPLFGFDPEQVLMILFIQGFFQLLVHTKLVKKLGILEYIFVTPSAHRVHHGKNDLYLDKNYGKFFILWDRLFGTYREETEEVEFGIKGETKYNHALQCIFKPYIQLLKIYPNLQNKWLKKKLLLGSPDDAEKIITCSKQG